MKILNDLIVYRKTVKDKFGICFLIYLHVRNYGLPFLVHTEIRREERVSLSKMLA